MSLFEPTHKRFLRRLKKCFFFVLPVGACCLFYLGISYTGTETITQEQATLKQALEQGAVHAYAMTGNYPQSLDELLSSYQITYDHEKFIVDYVPTASNLFPSIDVLIRTAAH